MVFNWIMGHVCNPRCALRSHISTNILCMFACNIILILRGYAPLLCRDRAITGKEVLLGRSFPAEPTQSLGFCMSNQKRTEFCRGEYLKPIVLEELVRGRPWVLEIYSHHKKRRGFLACSYLWGNSKFEEGRTDGAKFCTAGRFMPQRWELIFALIAAPLI